MRSCLLPLALVILIPTPAPALTPPASGAAARPAGLTLAAPFPCNVAYRVTNGYGDNMHTNIDKPLNSNDYHALDLVRDEGGNGHDKPVTAAAAGTVKYAGWASGGWSTYGQIVYIELDFKDGHSYQLLYAHLEKVLVSTGQKVKARDIVGHLGKSGDSSLTYWGSSHLHLAFYRDATLQTSPTVGPYGGVAAVPEPLDGVEDFVVGTKATVSCAPQPDTGPPPPKDSGPSLDDSRGPPDASGTPSDGHTTRDLGGLPPPASDSGGSGNGGVDDGCSCRVGSLAPSPAILPVPVLVLFVVLFVRRRR